MTASDPVSTKIEVIVVFSNEDKELVQNVNATLNSNNEILVSSVMGDLKVKGYAIDGLLIAYFCEEREIYVHIGRDPLPEEATIPITEKKRISLRFRQDSESHNSADRIFSMGNSKQTVSVRSKERKISEILEKVAQWRRLYGGVRSKEGEVVQYSLEDAAKHVGISKKSLDDYLLQIKLGKKYGFDFNANKDRGVGTLRSFVKKHRKLSGNDTPTKDSDDELPLQNNTQEVFMKATYDKHARQTVNPSPAVSSQMIALNNANAMAANAYNSVQFRNTFAAPQHIGVNPELLKNYQMMQASSAAAHNQYGVPGLVAVSSGATPVLNIAGITTTPTTTTTTTNPAGLMMRNMQ
mmetsp:Transcript_40603/g.46627  ORF Transcript_40603/g.46627 Transcript_40603/m.46627 type:complete len:352 (+) Transcript_40603:2051-3106(+)